MNAQTQKVLDIILRDGSPEVAVEPVAPKMNYVGLWQRAVIAADAALAACTPTPMVVTAHKNPLDDNSPVAKQWYVPEGACGFASVHVPYKGKGAEFIRALKKAGLAGEGRGWQKHYQSGFYFWVSAGGQSIDRKEAWAQAAVDVLREAGIDAWSSSRLD